MCEKLITDFSGWPDEPVAVTYWRGEANIREGRIIFLTHEIDRLDARIQRLIMDNIALKALYAHKT